MLRTFTFADIPYAEAHRLNLRPQIVATRIATLSADQMSLAQVKNRLSEVIDRLEREHGRVVITKHGRAAVLLSIDDLESLEETLDVMSNANLVADIREALAGARRGAADRPRQGPGTAAGRWP